MRISDWSSDVCSSDLIDPAVAIAVAREPEEDRGQELRPAGRARPASLERRCRHAGVDHLERGDEFARKQRPPPPFIGKRGERARQIAPAKIPAVISLMHPDRDNPPNTEDRRVRHGSYSKGRP